MPTGALATDSTRIRQVRRVFPRSALSVPEAQAYGGRRAGDHIRAFVMIERWRRDIRLARGMFDLAVAAQSVRCCCQDRMQGPKIHNNNAEMLA